MRYAVVCQSRSHAELLVQALGVHAREIAFAVESQSLERALKRQGCDVMRGSFRERALYRKLLPADLLIVILKDKRRTRTVLASVRRARGETPVLVLALGKIENLPVSPDDYPWAHFVSAGESFAPTLRSEVRLTRAKTHVRRLRELLSEAKKILILLQDDPDPDGLACGLALRTLLGRTRKTMPMASFGAVTRPENIEMCRVLDLDPMIIKDDDLSEYERIVMLDTQPPHLRQQLPRVDVVIDHHPAQTSYEARFKDVRNAYGATATILVEYLRSAGIKVNERLGTALFYAIRTDTLLLDRPVTPADVEAFTWLFTRSNSNWIRRIERPALPRQVLGTFAEGLAKARIEDRVVFSHLGRVAREDVIPQLADFCLQVEDVDWSAVSGVFGDELIMSVRNVGFVQAAGTIVKSAYAELGAAGGHRSMAKVILPLESVSLSGEGEPSDEAYRMIEEKFLAALRA